MRAFARFLRPWMLTVRCRRTLRASQRQSATAYSIATLKRYERPSNRSRPAREREELQRLAPGSGLADADEQSRSRRGREPGPADRLRRDRPGRAQLGGVRRDCAVAPRTGER